MIIGSLPLILSVAWPQHARGDLVAAILIAVGLLCQTASHRLPAGLGTSLFVGATSIGAGVAAWTHDWSPAWSPWFAVRVSSVLVLVWTLFGSLARRSDRAVDERSGPSDSSTFLAWALVIGIAVVVQVVYGLVFRTMARLFDPNLIDAEVSIHLVRSAWDLTALIGACLVWRRSQPQPHQPIMLLTLGALLVWCTSLMMPTFMSSDSSGEATDASIPPAWWDWTFHSQVGLTLMLFIAAILQDHRHRTKRHRAWPDRLDDLLAPYSSWPAYSAIESVIVAAVLVLSVYQIIGHGSASRALVFASLTSCAVAGWTCLFVCYRRWSGNTAGLGMALLSLAMVKGFALGASTMVEPGTWAGYTTRIPILFNAALFALALMIVWWRWLSGVWRQQLLDSRPWTTTGRLIPYARRTAFFLSALAVLAAFHMAMWPHLAPAREDDGWGRICFGLTAIAILGLITTRKARRDNSITSASLAVALAVAAIMFIFIRMPTSPLRGWLKQYDEVVLGAVALPMLLIAETISRTAWRSFSSPLWMMALLFLPAAALLGLLARDQPEEWIRPMTLAILGALYSFAGSREHRRAFLLLGGTLLIASLSTLLKSYGGRIMG